MSTFEAVERKVLRPPAAHNVAGLLDPNCETRTTRNIARFAVGIPAFNYSSATSMCIDKVRLSLDLPTALKAVGAAGAPAGRDQNASLVRAFFLYDDHRGYSKLQTVDPYDGQYLISRDIKVPTRATFVVVENGKQIPVVMCGWQNFKLERDQIRAWLTMLESGLFSFADYRHSPWEVILFPGQPLQLDCERQSLVIRPGDYSLFTQGEMRELSAMFARAQRAAMPIARGLWEAKEARRREKLRNDEHIPGGRDDDSRHPDLFTKD